MLFKNNDSANLVSKSAKYWKNCPQARKRKNHKMLYLTWKVRFLYCFTVSNILTDNLIKTYLKLRNIHFKQIAKSIPTLGKKPCRYILLKPDFVLYPIDISSCEIIFLLISHVFIVLYGVLTLYCVFEK
jgi:hypothetical protein